MTDDKIMEFMREHLPHAYFNSPMAGIRFARAMLSASIADTAGAKAAAYVNGDELDNMLEDRVATIQGRPDGWRKTPLFANQPERLVALERICEGITDEMIEGGWTAKGISQYAKSLEERLAATPPSSVADAHTCAQAVLDLRGMLLRLIKYEGMANDDATNKLYQKTTDALFAASRIKEGAPSVADAAGAGEDERDAARYRWLVKNCFDWAAPGDGDSFDHIELHFESDMLSRDDESVGRAIDAEIAKESGK